LYIKCFAEQIGKNKFNIHLWTDKSYKKITWYNQAYIECSPSESEFKGFKDENLKKIWKWDKQNPLLHFHDMAPYQKFLIERYGIDSTPSTTHRILFFDIECEMLEEITEVEISNAPKKITSIAWWDKQLDKWGILVLDTQLNLKYTKFKNKEIIPCKDEEELLSKFIEGFREIDPDILVTYNGCFFDIPDLYYRICNVLGEDWANMLSPIGIVKCKKNNDWWFNKDTYVQIAGVESLDYYRLHKKYYWRDEPSYTLDAIGKKYAGLGKIEYDGNLDDLFKEDIHKFINYNFIDVEILKKLDEKLQYIDLTINISHKGKHNYSEVYASSKTHDGAISAYLLSQGIIPPARERNQISKKGYAGGYLFCPKAGLYKYMFDEDLTSQYPFIIISLNIGRETLVARIIDDNDRNNRLGLNDLKERDPDEELVIENSDQNKRVKMKVSSLIKFIIGKKLSISANGVMFRTDKKSVMAIVLEEWFNERVEYKRLMKEAYKAGDEEKGDHYFMIQNSFKILLNSLYGASSLPSFRYGKNKAILSEAITLTGWSIIQQSALCANNHINKIMKDPKFKEEFMKSLPCEGKVKLNI